MTDGASCLLAKQLAKKDLAAELRPVLESAYRHLTSRNPSEAWTSGQWMTERAGGSDVSGTETVATFSPDTIVNRKSLDGYAMGPWSINGFKWFSSATDSNMTILLARTPKGVSTFFAPMRQAVKIGADRPEHSQPLHELNGVRIQRLKNKLGTKAVPTAELELKDMRAHLLGTEGQGVKEIATILNITRIHTGLSAAGSWARGLMISRAFARVRKTGGRLLIDIPAHMRTMAEQSVRYRAAMHLTFFTIHLLGLSEQPSSVTSPLLADPTDVALLLRVLTPVMKGTVSKAAIAGLQECMESLGGVGYLENEEMEFNVARLFRNANVHSIWEGTTDVMAHDTMRVLKGRQGKPVMESLERWVDGMLKVDSRNLSLGLSEEKHTLRTMWKAWKDDVEGTEKEELTVRSREVMDELNTIISGILLVQDALRDQDPIVAECARRWLKIRKGESQSEIRGKDWRKALDWDRQIVFGESAKAAAKL
jgi:alkylation response protein AidB-like acyl-CoA dehydrogenase